MITAEEFVPEAEHLLGTANTAFMFAEPLAKLVSLCSSYPVRAALAPAPPWVGWEHEGSKLWPAPDDLDVDLNDYPEPGWLDQIAERAARFLRAIRLPRVIGHADWHAGNISWANGELHVVHDWDSLALLPEAAIAGGASVLYAASSRAGATLIESSAFLDAYARARGHRWTEAELRACWAAGLWNMAFDAKKQAIDGIGDSLALLQAQSRDRLELAGL